MAKYHAAPASKTRGCKAWAAISEDVPPEIYEVAFWRVSLRQDLRHMRVMVTPIIRKSKSLRRATGRA